jgi:hypothetical protein
MADLEPAEWLFGVSSQLYTHGPLSLFLLRGYRLYRLWQIQAGELRTQRGPQPDQRVQRPYDDVECRQEKPIGDEIIPPALRKAEPDNTENVVTKATGLLLGRRRFLPRL